MNKKYITKLMILNLSIVLVNILGFANEWLTLNLVSDAIIKTALGYTVVIMSVIIFGYGNFKLIYAMNKANIYVVGEYDTPREFVIALNSCEAKQTFARDIDTIKSQIKQLERKERTLEELFFQKYKEEISDVSSMKQVVEDTGKLLFENVKKILNRMTIFDQIEYDRLMNTAEHTQAYEAKYQLFQEHIKYVRMLVEQNESILLEFDNLLVEVSKMGDEDEDTTMALNTIKDTIRAMQLLRGTKDDMSEMEEKYK